VSTINVAPQTVILKTDQAQVVFEGKSKSHSFELGMFSFAGKLSDLIRFSTTDNPIKNSILNSIDFETENSLAILQDERKKLNDVNDVYHDIGFEPVKLEFPGAKSYSIQFKSSRSNKLFILINLLDLIAEQALSLETSSLISSSVRQKTIYRCQNKIRRIFSITYKKIDDLLNIKGAIELLKINGESFSHEFNKFPNKDEVLDLFGSLDVVSHPIREL